MRKKTSKVFEINKIRKRTFSESMINRYIQCPKWCYHSFIVESRKKIKKEVIEQTSGKEVHKFICSLYVKTGKGQTKRKFHYYSLDSALKAWHIVWTDAIQRSKKDILNYSIEKDKHNRWLGIECISKYWNQNYNRPDPLAREIKYSIILFNNPNFVYEGRIDEIRTVDIETIKKYRPEIVVDGVLLSSYDPVVIVDLKTGYYDYELGAVGYDSKEITNPWTILWQFVGYTKLYREHHNGRNPVGCVIYDLYTGNQKLIVMEDPKYWDLLMEHVIHIKKSIDSNSFPRTPRREKCAGCGVKTLCWQGQDEDLYKFIPLATPRSELLSFQSELFNTNEEYIQPRLQLKGVKRQFKNPQV